MTKAAKSKPFTATFLSLALAISVSACSSGSGDPLTDAQTAFEAHEYGAARIHILTALKENSADPKANLMFGKILLEMGDGVGAAAAFKKIMNKDAYKAQALPLYAHALLLSGASDKALELSNDAGNAALDPAAMARLYWVKACALLDLGRSDEALAVMNDALATLPKDVPLLVLKAKYHLTTGNFAKARNNAALALKSGPDDLVALEFSGRLAMLRQDMDAAKTLFSKAEKLYPESIVPLFSLAAIYADLGEEKKSREYFARVLKAAPNHPLALFMLAQLEFDKGEIAKAHDLLQTAGDGVADVPQAILLTAKIAGNRGNHEMAIAHAQKFLRMMPGNVDGITILGKSLLAAGNGAEAYQVVRSAAMQATASPELLALAAKLAGQQGDAMASKFAVRAKVSAKGDIAKQMKRADVAIKDGDWKQAGAVYASLRSSGHQNNPMILNNSALVALELGDGKNAVRHARAALALAPDDAFVLDTMGWVLLKQGGDKAEALVLIKKAAERAPGNAEILGHLAEAYSANGNAAAAAQINKRLPATS